MNVLSLFDGISCSMVALKRNQISVAKYYACEIDKHAIKVSKENHPEIEHLGDVRQLGILQNLDLLIGGSPCQDLSIAKKGRKGLEGERSGLFWEYVRILRESKPKYFVLENVNSMPKEAKETITKELGVQPIMINASLVSAQCRKRLFWTNIPVEGLPEDRKIFLKDILEPKLELEGSSNKPVKLGYIGNSDSQGNRVYSPKGKSVTLSANSGGLGSKTGLYMIYTPSGKSTEIIRTGTEVRRKLKDGVRADSDPNIIPIRRIEVRNDDKCGTLTTVLKDNQVVNLETKKVRKLTPIECERLQGLPDDYTKSISNTQRYKCLGNAFNVDVICFILSKIT